MKPKLGARYSKTILLLASLSLQLAASSAAKAGSRDPLFPGVVRPSLDYRTPPVQGYLLVYSATDRFDDGGAPYYPHSSYSIFAADGRLFKKVANRLSPSDESPELVSLPAGIYTIDVRSEKDGLMRVRVMIAADRRTVLVLDRENGQPVVADSRQAFARRLND